MPALRLVLPALEGAEPPPLRDLAGRLGLSERQAANHLLTARRVSQPIRNLVPAPSDMAYSLHEDGHVDSSQIQA